MRVGHVIPAYRQACHVEVAMAMAREAAYCASQGWEHVPFWVDVPNIARARNIAVEKALEYGFRYLLMQDADVFAAPPISAIERLHATMTAARRTGRGAVAVVGAAVAIRNGAGMNCTPAEPGTVADGIVGTGLMLIDLVALRALPRPWFVHEDDDTGTQVECGEDIYFCELVRAAGARVLVDYTFPTGHASTGVVGTLRPEPPVTRTPRGESAGTEGHGGRNAGETQA